MPQDNIAEVGGVKVDATVGMPVKIISGGGSSATDLGKAEDAAHTSGDVGVMSLSVRRDTAATTAGTDGDYAALTTDATGRQWTHVDAITMPTVIYNGKKAVTTAGTRVTLASSQAILAGVSVKALAANTGTIYVGDGSVSSTTGYALAAGDSVFLEVANLNTVNLDCSVNGEGVTYIAS